MERGLFMKAQKVKGALLFCGWFLLFATMAFAGQQNDRQTGSEPKGNLFVNISTTDPELMYAAVRIAKVAAQRGHGVTLLLRVGAIDFARKNKDYPIFGTTIKQKLRDLMETGSQVIVGGGCLKLKGIPRTDLMEGVTVGTPDIVMGALFKKDTRILSY